jgi:hypothetical protein
VRVLLQVRRRPAQGLGLVRRRPEPERAQGLLLREPERGHRRRLGRVQGRGQGEVHRHRRLLLRLLRVWRRAQELGLLRVLVRVPGRRLRQQQLLRGLQRLAAQRPEAR